MILRPATADDALPLLQWQRHPDTRRYARNAQVPEVEEHSAWFAEKIADPDCRLLIAEDASGRIGCVRLDRRGNEWEISIVVAPEKQRQGVGKAMLAALIKLPPPGPLVAEVLSDNEASHRLFRVAGWHLCQNGLYRFP